MKYTIITDSCCDLYDKDLTGEKIDFHVVPLTLLLGEDEYVDDEKLDTGVFVQKMVACKSHAHTACPSPEAYAQIMRKSDNIIILTVSSKLSGTYASAMAAAETVKSEFPTKKIFVLDTLSASAGQVHLCFKARDLIESGKYNFDEICVKLTEIRSKTRARFLLQDLNNLVKSGRMSSVVGRLLNTAKIKLICGDNGAGEIKKYTMAMGTKSGLLKIAEMPCAELGDQKDSPIVISHVRNEADATFLKGLLESKSGFKNITIRLMRGVATLYASDKGIVVAY